MKKIFSLFFLILSFSLFAIPKAVIFDFGGVLAKPDEKKAKSFILRTFQFPAVELDIIKKERLAALNKGLSETEFWVALAEKRSVTLPENWKQEFQSVIADSMNVNEEMYLIVEELKSHEIPVGLLSNIDNKAARLIRDCGLYQPFEPCLLSCEIGVDKPHQKAYETLIEKLSLLPTDVVFIDDLQENVDAARKAGIDAILFESAPQIREELKKRGCF